MLKYIFLDWILFTFFDSAAWLSIHSHLTALSEFESLVQYFVELSITVVHNWLAPVDFPYCDDNMDKNLGTTLKGVKMGC